MDCKFCEDKVPAVKAMPQSSDEGKTIDMVACCADHAVDWWDAADWDGRHLEFSLPIVTKLVSSEHGFHDYDVEGLPNVHRACVGDNIKKGDVFNVYCHGGIKLGAVWSGNLEQSLFCLAAINVWYRRMLETPKVETCCHCGGYCDSQASCGCQTPLMLPLSAFTPMPESDTVPPDQ